MSRAGALRIRIPCPGPARRALDSYQGRAGAVVGSGRQTPERNAVFEAHRRRFRRLPQLAAAKAAALL
jgi:hypothetical protein